MDALLSSSFDSIPVNGIKGPASSGCLNNFYNRPLWIRDITFSFDWTIPSRGVAQAYGTPLGDAIRASVKIGNHPMTAGFIPVCLLGPVGNARSQTPALRTAAQVTHSTFTWRLPEPLWLPPNMPISMQIQHVNDFTVASAAGDQTVQVAIRGIFDEKDTIPETVDVPYATSFLTPVETDTSGATTGVAPPVVAQSAQTDLFNPFTVPLNVERLSFEISVASTGLDGATRANFAPTDAVSAQDQTGGLTSGQNYGLDRRYVTLKMVSGKGRGIINNYVPIGVAIPSVTRTWMMNAVLDPADYYVAFISQQMPLFTQTLAFQMRTGLAMVGSRRLTLSEFAATY